MTDPNGAEDKKAGGVEGESKDGAKNEQSENKASSPKTYKQEEVNKLLKDKENELKGQEGWGNKKLQEEITELKTKNEAAEKAGKEIRLKLVAEKYGVELEKVKKFSEDPELAERAFEFAGKEPAKSSFVRDSGKSEGGGEKSTEQKLKERYPTMG